MNVALAFQLLSRAPEKFLAFFLPKGFDSQMKFLVLILFLNDFGRTLVTVFIPLYLLIDLHASYLFVGVALAFITGMSALFQAIGGALADAWGRKKSMVTSTGARAVVVGVLTVYSFYGPSFVIFVLLFAVSEALNGIFTTSTNAMVADVVQTSRRVEAYGVYRVSVNLGYTLGAFIGGLVAYFYQSFIIWTILIVLNLIPMLLVVKESNPVVSARFQLKSMVSAAKDRTLLSLALVSIGAGLIANSMGPTLTLFSTQYLGITKVQVGSINSLNGIIVTLFQYGFSRFTQRHSLSKFIALSVLVQATGFLFVGFSTSFLFLQASVILITIGEMLQAPTGTAFSAAIAPESHRGEYIGFYSWGLNSGMALSPFVGGLLLTLFATTPVNSWVVLFGIGIVSSIGYLGVGRIARKSLPNLEKVL
jgi:MFS family permease